ncbi:MAG: Cna B-type domain-containing protein [Bacillota bacterium]|nr:Cna B-type domain-containing protein [Bacillota bacterium]
MSSKMKKYLSITIVLVMLAVQFGANIRNMHLSGIKAETNETVYAPEVPVETQAEAAEDAAPEEAPAETTAAPEEAPVETTAAPEEAPAETTAAPEEAPAETTTAPEEAPAETTAAPEEAPAETTAESEEVPAETTAAPEEPPTEAPEETQADEVPTASDETSAAEAPETPDVEADAPDNLEETDSSDPDQDAGEPAPFSGFGLFALNPGETIKEILDPDPNTFKVMVGTALNAVGLPATVTVVYNKTDGSHEARDEAVTWDSEDSATPYNSDKDGDYAIKATFADASLAAEEGPSVTVTVTGQALADEITNLPSVADAANLTAAEKTALRSKLIEVSNALSLLTPDEKTAFEAYLGAVQMGKYQELYDTYVMGDGAIADSLDGDWAYLSRFEMAAIHDGTGPFDTSDDPLDPNYKNRKGNDDGPSNGKVRTYDTVSYDLSYSTAVSGEYAGIKNGYLYYEFILPYPADQAEWEFTGMTWIGIKVADKADLATKKDGESYYHYEVRDVDGVTSQVITGKRFLAPVEPNPSVFPGTGTLNAVARVLNVDNGSTFRPKFRAWLEHNHTDGVCPTHDREEVKTLIADPVTVTSELRMNVQLRAVSEAEANGLATFNFATGNDLALNKEAGNVYGRLTGYGITLQAYNLDPNDGLKGVAFPTGPITFDLEFATRYLMDNGAVVDNLPAEYTPLVWSYERNVSLPTQADGRDIAAFVPNKLARFSAPYSSGARTTPIGTYSPLTGTANLWNGGTWTASQTGNKVSFTAENYVINPNFFPNTDAGNSSGHKTYFSPENGVRSTHIGSFAAGEVFIITPFGEGAKYLPTRYGNSGTIELVVKDINLRASTATGDSLPIVTDNSNQSKPNRVGLPTEDDTLTRTVWLSRPGTWDNRIKYLESDTGSFWRGVDGTIDNNGNGKDTATRNQEFAIGWGGIYNPNGEQENAVYGLNALMKFDPNALELVRPPRIHTNFGDYLDPNTNATFLYAVKKDGTAWISDREMDDAVEADLDYYKTLEEAQAKGFVVGILAEARNDNPRVAVTYSVFSVQVKVKAAAETDKVYQVVERVKVWRKAQFDEAGGVIPRRYDHKDAVIYPEIPVYEQPDGSLVTLNDWRRAEYKKAVYVGGANVGGHNGSDNVGDSVYLTPYHVGIKKEVAQVAGSDQKKNFDLDANQRTVDFKLSPSIKTLVPSSIEQHAEVVIVDVLPKGLTYISGSAYYGGTYTQNPTPGQQGTVTGGEKKEPSALTDPDTGITTLTWTIPNVLVNDPMPDIIFSATIGKAGSPDDVVNAQHLINKVSISATEDNRPKKKTNGNYDEVGITVSKLLSTSLAKLAVSQYVEIYDNVGWKAYVSNNGKNPYTDTVILDVLPYNGDAGGTKFAPGTVFQITDWSVNMTESTLDNLGEWEVYYTTDENVWGTRSDDYAYADIRAGQSTLVGGKVVTWTKATLDPAEGLITGVEGNVKALASLGTLKGGQTLVQNIELSAEPRLKAGDVLANTLSRAKDETDTPVHVLQRTLEGLLWLDENADGVRQSGEVLFSQGTVSLLIVGLDGNYAQFVESAGQTFATIPLGKQLDLVTGVISDFEPGRYKFVGLPEGTFGVYFQTNNISEFSASPQDVGSDYTDSDAEAVTDAEVLKATIIKGIKMPARHEMASSLYASRFNDSGLYAMTDVSGSKTWDDADNQDGVRPTSITIKLHKKVGTGAVTHIDSQVVQADASGNWTWSFANLPKYEAGKKVTYSITEDAVASYVSKINGYDVTNTHNPEKTSVKVTKSWNDVDNQDGIRPASVTVQLYADGKKVDGKILTLNVGNSWTGTFSNLPKNAAGKPIDYTVDETSIPDGYTKEITGTAADGFTIINSHTPALTSVNVTKAWNDADNKAGVRPTDVTVQLYADSKAVEGKTLTLNAGNSWKGTFSELPKYKAGKLISYSVDETEVPAGYAKAITGTAAEGYTITNSRAPAMTVEKTTDKDHYTKVGEEITYTIKVKNTGTMTLENVVVTDSLVDLTNTEKVTFTESKTTDGKLEVGETWTYTYVHKVTQDDMDRGFVKNAVKATNPDIPDDPENPPPSIEVTTPVARMTIEKSADKDRYTKVGDVITYTVKVKNTGEITLENVVVTDSLVDLTNTEKVTFTESKTTDGKLEVGETWTYTYVHKVTQDDMDRGFVKNAVTATNPDIPDDPENPPPTTEVTVPVARMTIEKSADKDRYTKVGDVITYTVKVKNTGEITLEDVVVTDSMSSLSGPMQTKWTKTIDKLEVGETWTHTYTYEVTEEDMERGSVTNAVTASNPDIPKDDPENPPPTTEVTVPVARMTIEKSADKDRYTKVGDVITYTVEVKNTGEVVLEDVVVTDSMSSLSGPMQTKWTKTIDKLEVGETWTYTYTYEVKPADMLVGFVKNAVTATNPDIPGDDPENPPPTDEVIVPVARMTIKKVADRDKFYNVGEVITYTIFVTNTGEVALDNVVVTDSMASLLGLMQTKWTKTIDRLEVGETWIHTYTYEVTAEDMEAGIVTNAVTASNPDFPGDDPLNPPPTDVVEVFNPKFIVTKVAAEDKYFRAGDIIHYTVTVENITAVAVENLLVEDSLPVDDMTLVESVATNGHLDAGETWTLTYTYEVTEADVAVGRVLNRVTVTNPADPDRPVKDETEVLWSNFTVTKEADEEQYRRAGDTITYTVKVKNTGRLPISGLEIKDTLVAVEDIAPTESLLKNDILDVSETWTYEYSYTVTEADVAAGHVLNKVTVTDPADPENPGEDEETVPRSSYTVVKEVAEPQFHVLGDTLHYTITVTNTGYVTITGLVVEDSLVPLSAMTLVESVETNGDLDVGETWTLTYTYQVTEADVAAGRVLNRVVVEDIIEGDTPPTDEVITPRTPDPNAPGSDPNAPGPVPRTGRDYDQWSLWLVLALLSAGVVLVVLRKKGFLKAEEET